MFIRVSTEGLTEEDMKRLMEITSKTVFGYQAIDVLKAEVWGQSQLWKWEDGLMITKVRNHPGGKELEVWGLAGRGVFKPGFKEACWDLARSLGCKWISAGVLGQAQQRLFAKKLGIKTRGVYFFEEV